MSRALRALSSTYVERRHRLAERAALAGRGKRAAFALFYGPLHFLLVRGILRALGVPPAGQSATGTSKGGTIVDAGCGTGAAGAAFALAWRERAPILAIDRSAWALDEAAWTYRTFGLSARVRRTGIVPVALPPSPMSFVAAFTVNELDEGTRDALLRRLIERGRRGDRILVVEPLARSVTPWWPEWRNALLADGGRADEWRLRVDLPDIVAKLDRAVGIDHRELTGRSLWLAR